MAEPRTIRSPKEDIAQLQLEVVQDAQTKLKQLIVTAEATGEPRENTIKKAAAIINEAKAKVPEYLQDEVRTSLRNSFQKWDAYYRTSTRATANAFVLNVQKLAKTRPELVNRNKTYTLDIDKWAKGETSSSAIVERFRPILTEDKRGAAIIDQYDSQVKTRLKALASDPATASPTYQRTNKDGSITTVNASLRNLVEVEVRYKANQADIDNLKGEGVDLVWTSSHADASERCKRWQGRLYSLAGKSGRTANGEPYTPFDEAQNANGGNSIISGYNCRHRIIEYQPGSKAPKEYDDKTIKRENYVNNRQRLYERDIRDTKVEERLARANGQNEYAHQLRQEWQARRDQYIDFSHKNERPYYLWRTRIVEGEQ